MIKIESSNKKFVLHNLIIANAKLSIFTLVTKHKLTMKKRLLTQLK
jgi:hypothetical protein